MLKKKNKNDVINPELKALLLENSTEDVVIGNNIYTLYPFTVEQMIKFMKQLNKYTEEYTLTLNELRNDSTDVSIFSFFSKFLDTIDKQKFIKNAIKDIWPNVDNNDLELMTYEQLLYFLTKVYELNFFREIPGVDKEVLQKVKSMLGIQF